MKKLYEDIALKTKHYIECKGDKNLLLDEKVIIRVIREEKLKEKRGTSTDLAYIKSKKVDFM